MNKTLQEDLAELIDAHSEYIKKLHRFEQRLCDDRTTPLRERYEAFIADPVYAWSYSTYDFIFDDDELEIIYKWIAQSE